MSKMAKRTVSMPAAQAALLDDLVARGQYSSVSEVVRAGLRALQEREEAVDRWLRNEVVPAYDATRADPTRSHPAEKVFSRVRSRASRSGSET